MKLQEAERIYQECKAKPNEHDCDTCVIGQREYCYQPTICNHLYMADMDAKKIEPECQQVDCQQDRDSCVDCVEGHLYQSPDKYEVVGER